MELPVEPNGFYYRTEPPRVGAEVLTVKNIVVNSVLVNIYDCGSNTPAALVSVRGVDSPPCLGHRFNTLLEHVVENAVYRARDGTRYCLRR